MPSCLPSFKSWYESFGLLFLPLRIITVRYSPKFYKDLLAPEGTTEYIYDPKFLKFAHYQGFTVGAVCCRMEEDAKQEGKYRLYIMIMNVLATYRRRGVATKLLRYVVDEAAKDDRITELVLHVQTSNTEAKEFYLANDFVEIEIVEDYYKRIDPTSAFLLTKQNDIVEEKPKEPEESK